MAQTFFIAVNTFHLRLKPLHRTILQTCCLSPSDREISFWLISPRLPVNANNVLVINLPVNALPAKTHRLKYFTILILALCFVSVYSKNFL